MFEDDQRMLKFIISNVWGFFMDLKSFKNIFANVGLNWDYKYMEGLG